MATPGNEPQPFVPALSVATLHPHHHPPHHHQHHGGTGASGGTGGGGGGSGGFNLPLNRGLERALEEAANSGGLNLSARKLKEFPRTAVPGHDLSDTVQAGEKRPMGQAVGVGGWLSCFPTRWPMRDLTALGVHPAPVLWSRRVGAGSAEGTVARLAPWCVARRAGMCSAAEPECAGPGLSTLCLPRRGSGRGVGTCGRALCAEWKWEVSS